MYTWFQLNIGDRDMNSVNIIGVNTNNTIEYLCLLWHENISSGFSEAFMQIVIIIYEIILWVTYLIYHFEYCIYDRL